jgi:hypothetical protein
MWRAREWGDLLNLIDHLPQNSHYYNAMMHDPKHAEAVGEWLAANPGSENDKSGPGWQTWSPEVASLADIKDELQMLRMTLIGVNGGKPGKFVPASRPDSMIAEAKEKAVLARKMRVHNMLRAKMLPHKYNADGTEKRT